MLHRLLFLYWACRVLSVWYWFSVSVHHGRAAFWMYNWSIPADLSDSEEQLRQRELLG